MCNQLKSKSRKRSRKRLRSALKEEQAEEKKEEEKEYQQEIEPPKNIQKASSDEEFKTDAKMPECLSHLINYLKEKSWYDLDFTLFDGKSSRLQLSCTCRSEAQLPECCADGNSSV